MPKVSEHAEAKLRSVIRDAMAIDPLISILSLQSVIEKKIERSIDRVYLTKLVRKVSRGTLVEVERSTVHDRIRELREKNRILIQNLMRIAFPAAGELNPPKKGEQLYAMDLIAKIERSQAKLEMDFGLFTRKLGEIEVNHRLKPIDDDTRANVIKAFENWAAPPAVGRRIEPQRIVEAESREITHEQPKPQPTASQPAKQPIPVVIDPGVVMAE